jgi:hypothetical protein
MPAPYDDRAGLDGPEGYVLSDSLLPRIVDSYEDFCVCGGELVTGEAIGLNGDCS